MITAKKSKVTYYFFVLLTLALLLTRFLFLDNKPIHFDESINGWFVLQTRRMGYYHYDPQNYHGPLYFYLLEIWTRIFGHGMNAMRSLPGIFSVGTALFFWRRSPWTAVLLLLSGSMIFYGRSSIHESAFVFGQVLFFIGLYEYARERRLRSLWNMLLGLALMLTLKETFVFTGLAAVLALAFVMPWRIFFRELFTEMRAPLIFFLIAVLLLFSGFGHHPGGVVDFFRAFTLWFKTSVHSGHEKPFWYWIQLAWQAEPLLCLAMLFTLGALFIRRSRVPAAFALLTWLIYSLVPYKTPWCMITWAWPFYFVMGEVLKEQKKWRSSTRFTFFVLFSVLAALNMRSIWDAAYRVPMDLLHPFVYVNSTYEYKDLDDALQRALRERPSLRNAPIQISLEEAWPMPWTLQDSNELHYDKIEDRIFPHALAYFCEIPQAALLDKELDKESPGGYVKRIMPLRQYGRDVEIYLRADIFPEFP